MALTAGTIFEIRASATTGNVNGAGFNIANAAFVTDLTTDADTANTASPVVSSATYNFAASDVGASLYVASGTDWTPGWYPIASVAANKATLNAAVGAAIQIVNGVTGTNTVAGCATVGTPTNGTFGIDYTQQDTAQATNTNLTCTAGSTTVTSAAAPFTRMMVGNLIHLTALTGTGAITGWYEIATFTDTSNIVLDRTPTNGVNNITAGTFYVGGAGRLNGLEDAFLEMIPAGSSVWIKSGTYVLSGTTSISSTNSTAASPSNIAGYTSMRGDTCNGANRPLFSTGANSLGFGVAMNVRNIIGTTSSSNGLGCGASAYFTNIKFTNTSTTASRNACNPGTNSTFVGCEFVSQNGVAINGSSATQTRFIGCYIHDSVTGLSSSAVANNLIGNIFEACSTAAVSLTSTSGGHLLMDNTFYGREAKMGIGVDFNANPSANNRLAANIFYGLTTGVNVSTAEQKSNFGFRNNYFNNTADVALFTKGPVSYAVDPQFTSASQITGSTATTSGSTLTQAGGDFSTVTDNVDYVRVISGTGVTVGCYLITGHTGTTITTNNALGTSSAGDVVYFITTGHNFAIGTNLKGLGTPTFASLEVETVGYPDVGAVQRQEAGGGSFTYVG